MSTVLVLNSGSSSLKYQLLDPESGFVLAVGLVERIGPDGPGGRVKHTHGDVVTVRDGAIADHGEALRLVLELFAEAGPVLGDSDIVAVGHRVVQGGALYSAPTVITDAVVAGIESLVPLAPLHNPAAVAGIRAARALFDVPQVAVFDTAFFAGLPPAAHTYALDTSVATAHAIRRYGFHGTSHQYVSAAVSRMLRRSDLRQIVLHLGNGASASAVVGGRAVETSMGLTPLQGLVMGTRSGDVDPAIVFHLSRVGGLDIDEIDDLLNKRSGLLGLSGMSDMREVRTAADAGLPQALLALEVYRHRLVSYIGAYTAVMGGIDALTFTAGVGENDDDLRLEVVNRLGFLGLRVDPVRNAGRVTQPRVISPDGLSAGADPVVLVVPTNEELAIARQAVAAINGSAET